MLDGSYPSSSHVSNTQINHDFAMRLTVQIGDVVEMGMPVLIALFSARLSCCLNSKVG